jgi:hypothetical protein
MLSQNINSFLEKHNLQQSVGGSEVKNEEEDTRAVVTSRLIDHIFESIRYRPILGLYPYAS